MLVVVDGVGDHRTTNQTSTETQGRAAGHAHAAAASLPTLLLLVAAAVAALLVATTVTTTVPTAAVLARRRPVASVLLLRRRTAVVALLRGLLATVPAVLLLLPAVLLPRVPAARVLVLAAEELAQQALGLVGGRAAAARPLPLVRVRRVALRRLRGAAV